MPAKLIYLARRRAGTTHAEFRRGWRGHARLAASLPGMTGDVLQVIQCARVQDVFLPRVSTDLDGVNLLTMPGLFDLAAIKHSPSIDVMLEDESRVFEQPIRDVSLATQQTAIVDGPVGSHVIIGFARRRPGITMEDFIYEWSGEFARGLMDSSVFEDVVTRYVHNHVVLPAPARYPFDGVFEIWCGDIDGAAALLAGENFGRLEAGNYGAASTTLLFCGEINLIAPRQPLASPVLP